MGAWEECPGRTASLAPGAGQVLDPRGLQGRPSPVGLAYPTGPDEKDSRVLTSPAAPLEVASVGTPSSSREASPHRPPVLQEQHISFTAELHLETSDRIQSSKIL